MRKTLFEGLILTCAVCWIFQEADAAAFLTNGNVFLPANYYTFTPPANGGGRPSGAASNALGFTVTGTNLKKRKGQTISD